MVLWPVPGKSNPSMSLRDNFPCTGGRLIFASTAEPDDGLSPRLRWTPGENAGGAVDNLSFMAFALAHVHQWRIAGWSQDSPKKLPIKGMYNSYTPFSKKPESYGFGERRGVAFRPLPLCHFNEAGAQRSWQTIGVISKRSWKSYHH